uniref:Rab-GAP TBC domain-containing protein n=1 Tax=Echinostoma caproni TaxID=27848 RepID=A0A183AM01_9TREM
LETVEPRDHAVATESYGALTRRRLEWHPDRILCKRINVPHPYPDIDMDRPEIATKTTERKGMVSGYVIYNTTNTKLLKFAEALAIHTVKPDLCKQRERSTFVGCPDERRPSNQPWRRNRRGSFTALGSHNKFSLFDLLDVNRGTEQGTEGTGSEEEEESPELSHIDVNKSHKGTNSSVDKADFSQPPAPLFAALFEAAADAAKDSPSSTSDPRESSSATTGERKQNFGSTASADPPTPRHIGPILPSGNDGDVSFTIDEEEKRPSMDLFKSIFASDEELSESDAEESLHPPDPRTTELMKGERAELTLPRPTPTGPSSLFAHLFESAGDLDTPLPGLSRLSSTEMRSADCREANGKNTQEPDPQFVHGPSLPPSFDPMSQQAQHSNSVLAAPVSRQNDSYLTEEVIENIEIKLETGENNALCYFKSRVSDALNEPGMERNFLKSSRVLDELTAEEKTEFVAYVQSPADKQVKRIRTALRKCINSSKLVDEFPADPKRFVHNLSSVNLDKTLLGVLSLGPKFCCPTSKTKQLDFEVEFESLFAQLSGLAPSSSQEFDKLKPTLVNSCYQYRDRKSSTKGLLTLEHLKRLRELIADRELMISRPDKGAGIVIMKRFDYIEKMRTILNDPSKFTKTSTEKDKTIQIEKLISTQLRCLKQKGPIDVGTFEKIILTGTTIPRLYGLPKVH